MTIELVTGVPGAGKTLYTMSEKLAKLVGTKITYKGREVERRLMVGNVRDLLLPHEPIEVPEWSPGDGRDKAARPEDSQDPFGDQQREPGEPPVEGVPHNAMCWWLWCRPGDVIVIDECQNLFRPMASGRKVPQFIAKLERHRHYGVDFVLITQHPQLLHSNVRNLVGRHEHLRRVFGGGACMLYEWDHCTHPDRVKNASTTLFRHKKKSFGLYKSAEVHTKVKHRVPWPVYMALAAVFALAAVLWIMKGRMETRFAVPVPVSAAASSAASAARPGVPLAARAAETVRDVVGAMTGAEPGAVAFVGCIHMGRRCECLNDAGKSIEVELQFCRDNSARSGLAIAYDVKPHEGSSAKVAPVKVSRDVPAAIPPSRPASAPKLGGGTFADVGPLVSSEPRLSEADADLIRFVHGR